MRTVPWQWCCRSTWTRWSSRLPDALWPVIGPWLTARLHCRCTPVVPDSVVEPRRRTSGHWATTKGQRQRRRTGMVTSAAARWDRDWRLRHRPCEDLDGERRRSRMNCRRTRPNHDWTRNASTAFDQSTSNNILPLTTSEVRFTQNIKSLAVDIPAR